MKTLFNHLFWGVLGLTLFSFPSLSQSQPLPSSFSDLAVKFVTSAEEILEGLYIQPCELDPESPAGFLSYSTQDAILSAAVPLQSLHNSAKLLDYTEVAYLEYFSRPPPRSIAS